MHTYPFLLENTNFPFADCPPVHTYPATTITENGTFKKRLRHGTVSSVRYEMANGHIIFVSLRLGLFPGLMACLDINLALLNVQADYVRRLNVFMSPLLPVSKVSLKCLDRERRQVLEDLKLD